MSLDLILQRTGKDGFIPFKRTILAEILGSHAVIVGEEIVGAEFSDQDGGEIYGARKENIPSLGFKGGGLRFLQAMWELANQTQSYIFWPDIDRPHLVVTSDQALVEIDPEIVDAVGPAIIVRNGRELSIAISGKDYFGPDEDI